MDRETLVVAMAAALLAAFLAGWVARWVFGRLSRSAAGAGDPELAGRLLEAEEAARAAEALRHAQERDFKTRLSQAEAEAAAAMDGLRSARAELAALRGN